MGMVAAVDWHVVSDGPDARSPFLEDLVADTADGSAAESDPSDDLLATLHGAAASERELILAVFLQQELQAVMRLPELPALSAEFADLGMDSLMVVELRNRLNRAFAGEYTVSNTAVFDYPTATGLARYLSQELGAPGRDRRQRPTAASSAPKRRGRCRLSPIRMESPSWAWPVGFPAPRTCWPIGGCWRPARTRSPTGAKTTVFGMVSPVTPPQPMPPIGRVRSSRASTTSTPLFFRISPKEAWTIDPLQRLLLETSWQAVEDAAIDPERLKGSRSGVYVGIGSSEYPEVWSKRAVGGGAHLNTAGSVTVGQVAFSLGMEGPGGAVGLGLHIVAGGGSSGSREPSARARSISLWREASTPSCQPR